MNFKYGPKTTLSTTAGKEQLIALLGQKEPQGIQNDLILWQDKMFRNKVNGVWKMCSLWNGIKSHQKVEKITKTQKRTNVVCESSTAIGQPEDDFLAKKGHRIRAKIAVSEIAVSLCVCGCIEAKRIIRIKSLLKVNVFKTHLPFAKEMHIEKNQEKNCLK